MKATKKPEALRTNEGDDLTTGDEGGANDF